MATWPGKLCSSCPTAGREQGLPGEVLPSCACSLQGPVCTDLPVFQSLLAGGVPRQVLAWTLTAFVCKLHVQQGRIRLVGMTGSLLQRVG